MSRAYIALSEDFQDLVHYIVENYQTASKIVEVGIGRLRDVATRIKQHLPNTILIAIDSNPAVVAEVKKEVPLLEAIRDDVRNPDLKVYKNADLIYSIRFPPELWPYLVRIAKFSTSDLIIKPLYDDLSMIPKDFALVKFRSASFLLRKKKLR